MGSRFEAVTHDINSKAVVGLAQRSIRTGVKRFVFASSCSMYGYADGPARRETDALNPLTAYARSKVDTETALAQMDPRGTTFTSLRFSTACGMSDRLRLDLVLNDFVACAIAAKLITVLSDGSPWRPLIDVADMARAIEWALIRAPQEAGPYVAVNVGSDDRNWQVSTLANAVAQAIPGTTVQINTNAPPDRRSYKVDFALFRSLAPQHQPQVSLEQSISKLAAGLANLQFGDSDFRSSDFMRLRVLQAHVESGRLDANLRWVA
jgi:UDP-glucose 4-epimerase